MNIGGDAVGTAWVTSLGAAAGLQQATAVALPVNILDGGSRDGMGDIGGAAAGRQQAAAAAASVNILGGGSRDGLGDIGKAAAGMQQAAVAVRPVNILDGGSRGDIGGAEAGRQQAAAAAASVNIGGGGRTATAGSSSRTFLLYLISFNNIKLQKLTRFEWISREGFAMNMYLYYLILVSPADFGRKSASLARVSRNHVHACENRFRQWRVHAG